MSERFMSVKEVLHEIDKLLDKEATIITKALSQIDDPLYRASLADVLSHIIANKNQVNGLRNLYIFGAPKASAKDKEAYLRAMRESVRLFGQATRLLQKLSDMAVDPRIKGYINIMLSLWKYSLKVGRRVVRR